MKGIAVIAVCAAIVGLIVAVVLATWIKKQDEGTDRMKEISGFIREGAFAFLKREYKIMVIVILVLFLLIGFCINWTTGILYICGAVLSVLAGFFGMNVATWGNVRTANVTLNYGSGGTTSCTTAFTVTQEPRDCACSDVTFNVTKTVLDCGGATNQQIGTYTLGCPNCSRSLLSKGGTFNQLTITFEDGKILATYPAAVGIKSGTLILKYNGNTCTTVSMSQRECCDCSNFTISPTAATWAYNVTTTSSLTISSGICISDITLSSLSHFTATKGNAVITVKPNSNNTGSSVIQETLTVSYKADGTKCTSKTIKLIHNPKNCDCSDLTITQTS